MPHVCLAQFFRFLNSSKNTPKLLSRAFSNQMTLCSCMVCDLFSGGLQFNLVLPGSLCYLPSEHNSHWPCVIASEDTILLFRFTLCAGGLSVQIPLSFCRNIARSPGVALPVT